MQPSNVALNIFFGEWVRLHGGKVYKLANILFIGFERMRVECFLILTVIQVGAQ